MRNLWHEPPGGDVHVSVMQVQSELEDLREATRAWGALRKKDGRLPEVSEDRHRAGELLVSADGIRWAQQARGVERHRRAVEAAALDAVAGHLADALAVGVMVFTDRPRAGLARRRRFQRPSLRLSFDLRSLAAALWWQFAREVGGWDVPRICPGCGRWFTPKRTDQATCNRKGSRCRMRWWRARSEEAASGHAG